MALTKNGNRRGAAARGTLYDQQVAFQELESTIPEDGSYWYWGAISAFDRLAAIVGYKRADELTGNWDDGRSWKEICLNAEELCNEQEER